MNPARTKVTVPAILKAKSEGRPLVMLTAYDATFARLADAADVDILLVGDSLGMVMQGHPDTLPVTLDEMIYHCKAVARGSQKVHIVGDLPFGSYQTSSEEALRSGMRLMKEGGVQSVKLEGGERVVESVAKLTASSVSPASEKSVAASPQTSDSALR